MDRLVISNYGLVPWTVPRSWFEAGYERKPYGFTLSQCCLALCQEPSRDDDAAAEDQRCAEAFSC